ncbi:hypothetical protein SHELI_v1c07980 [Spiroplasma helicoides]|uniref:Uncharacterized protein n=1 Tax=Spiroplasma helicoides TaxID=216938 RepID=A0A1B3SLF1_9MOLU|nr:hypothetical protein [Spiroplasma helicoides]AOG60747.1 hypothetical protein SHELI_v1c07980 [Spiroplasma helicoides]
MKEKKKKIKGENKFGVFNGIVINSETLGNEQEFKIEEYKDDSLTITELKTDDSQTDANVIVSEKQIKPKRKINLIIYKIIASLVILLIIISIIVYLILKLK